MELCRQSFCWAESSCFREVCVREIDLCRQRLCWTELSCLRGVYVTEIDLFLQEQNMYETGLFIS